MTISGCATLAGTNHFRGRFQNTAPDHFRNAQQLWLSSIGIGTYLGDADAQTDQRYVESVTAAVELGANVIDSAANYRFQRSERSVGSALRLLIEERGFGREEIVLCTKGGYLPFDGAPPRDVRRYIEETFVQPGIASFAEIAGGSHCMTPRYLENQLDQSRKNLGVDCIDVYYIHNPESQLGSVSEDEFLVRLSQAFEFLETARADGKIQSYGVATWNGFRSAPESRQFHSLTRMLELARTAGGEAHGFRFIQLPFNLAMPEALTLRNEQVNGEEVSTIEAAGEFGVTVVASASILQGRVAQDLPEAIREPLGSLETDAQTAIQFVRSTPGVTTALVGMSSRDHVAENLRLAAIPPASPEDFVRVFSN
jgi:aryl-alcohol dehydrogenase-like predicted oxidoreductase